MKTHTRILLVWVEAVAFTILFVWLLSPTRLLLPLYVLAVLSASLFMTHTQLIKTKRDAFKTEPRLLPLFGWICSFVLFGALTIMVLRYGYSVGPEWLGRVGQVLFCAGALICIAWFIYEDLRLFKRTVT